LRRYLLCSLFLLSHVTYKFVWHQPIYYIFWHSYINPSSANIGPKVNSPHSQLSKAANKTNFSKANVIELCDSTSSLPRFFLLDALSRGLHLGKKVNFSPPHKKMHILCDIFSRNLSFANAFFFSSCLFWVSVQMQSTRGQSYKTFRRLFRFLAQSN